MKLMKHIPTALALCAIPAMAVGQVTTTCTGCTHALSHYMGSGGFVATATEGTKMMTWVSQCGGLVQTGELTPNADGMVSALFSEQNGLACMAEKSSFEVGPVMDGGWFWITDEMNSAVGLLVNKEVYKALKDDAIKITSDGDGVKMTAGMGAVHLKETATGRVGILPNILPKKPAAALRPCGFTGSGTSAKKLNTSCQLGDGSAIGIAFGTNAVTGTTTRIPDGGSITRPAGDGTVEFTVTGWMKPGGHFLTDSGDARRGHSQFAGTDASEEVRLMRLNVEASVGSTGPFGTELTLNTAKYGVTVTSDSHGAKVQVAKDENFCSKTNNVSLPLTVELAVTASSTRDQVTPRIKAIRSIPPGQSTDGGDVTITRNRFMIVCPAGSGSASAHQGRELTPDDPFPGE